MHHRRARPTLRVLREDLRAGWDDPGPLRSLQDARLTDLHPVSELPHPVIRKAVDTFGHDPDDDNPEGLIACTKPTAMFEIKIGQWRGAVWRDPETGVHWLCAAGLAKGNHQDKDDFYAELEALHARADDIWKPGAEDSLLLKQETLARVVTAWRLEVQALAADALRTVCGGGTVRFDVRHPMKAQEPGAGVAAAVEPGRLVMAAIELTVAASREPGLDGEDCLVEVLMAPQFKGSQLGWQLTLTLLTSLCPTYQEWDVAGGLYSMIGERGSWSDRVVVLDDLVERNELAATEPGKVSHYCHTEHLAGRTIEGKAVRGMCGTFFVPTQDHEKLPTCPECDQAFAALPR